MAASRVSTSHCFANLISFIHFLNSSWSLSWREFLTLWDSLRSHFWPGKLCINRTSDFDMLLQKLWSITRECFVELTMLSTNISIDMITKHFCLFHFQPRSWAATALRWVEMSFVRQCRDAQHAEVWMSSASIVFVSDMLLSTLLERCYLRSSIIAA